MNNLERRVHAHLPKKPYCSDDKTASLIRNVTHALTHSYIQLNSHLRCAWLIFDIDTPFTGEYAWELNGLPYPNYIAMNPDDGKYHMAYAINPVFTSENARSKPLAYLAAIQRTYKRLLGADEGYAHLMTKNPLHSDWRVVVLHDHEYSLAELHDGCGDLDKKEYSIDTAELCDYERNVSLFNVLRYYAYGVVHNFDTCQVFHADLESHADQLNQSFKEPMHFKEVEGIAKSIANWTWRNKANIRLKERKLNLDTNQPLETRQAVGAHYTNQKRTDSVLKRINEAYTALLAEGKKATQKAVQERSGTGIATVKRYWKQVKS
ncbi:replication initiation protein [Vibrio splendidus]|uniref:replication initiation protein n=2 Tax=Vibrio TaxID=662 RepID=UPI00354FF098